MNNKALKLDSDVEDWLVTLNTTEIFFDRIILDMYKKEEQMRCDPIEKLALVDTLTKCREDAANISKLVERFRVNYESSM